VIAAHDSPLAAISFSPSGEKLATASEKVCTKHEIIRVQKFSDNSQYK